MAGRGADPPGHRRVGARPVFETIDATTLTLFKNGTIQHIW
ncbi:hypothetical protein [Dictyobacter vulcani]|nr:hypothetical protein [Dictyobacter vulcani]